MTPELEFEFADYHLRLMIERMQRNGRSELAIESAVRIAASRKPPAERRVHATSADRAAGPRRAGRS
jgi:hypothetical protein